MLLKKFYSSLIILTNGDHPKYPLAGNTSQQKCMKPWYTKQQRWIWKTLRRDKATHMLHSQWSHLYEIQDSAKPMCDGWTSSGCHCVKRINWKAARRDFVMWSPVFFCFCSGCSAHVFITVVKTYLTCQVMLIRPSILLSANNFYWNK